MDLNKILSWCYGNEVVNIIEFLKEYKLIVFEAPTCCDKKMAWAKRNSLSDKLTWRCNKCSTYLSIRHKSFFQLSSIPISKIILIIYFWCIQSHHEDIKETTGISRPTISELFQRLRSVVIY